MKKLLGLIFSLVVIGGIGYFVYNYITFNKGSYKFPDFNVSVDKKGKEITTKIESGATGIQFGFTGEGSVDQKGNKTIVDEKNLSYEYEVKKDGAVQGLKETIVLKNENAPTEFDFDLNLQNVSKYEKDKKGVWHFYNIQNKEIFYIPKGFMEDNKGASSDGVDIEIKKEGDKYKMHLTADKEWVQHPFRSFPIKIDPSVLVVGPKLSLNVTSIGRFRWKLSVEYEIKDESGKVLGSDVVILDVKEGEGNKEIAGFLKDYLTRRLATWALSQGNYSLYEMSNDRLNSPNFKAADSGDEVDDEYKKERQNRKKLIDSFNINDYPVISLTSSEAYDLQNPVFNVVDRNGVPTGQKKSEPTFQVKNEKMGAGTEILRPNGAGDATQFEVQNPGSGEHWDKVDDVAMDDDATNVQKSCCTIGTDYYQLTNTALTSETINSIDLTKSGKSPNYATGSYRGGVRLNSSNSYGASINGTPSPYTTSTSSDLPRPGGGSWVVGDLNGLQSAIEATPGIYYYQCCGKGSCVTCEEGNSIVISQIYVTVNYTAGPTPTPVPEVKVQGGIRFQGGTKLR